MATYEPFNDQRVASLAISWVQHGLTSVHIVMGPLTVVVEPDIYNSTIRIVTAEAGQVSPASLRWFDIRYLVFRAIYGLLRMMGMMNWEWELPNGYIAFDLILYQTIVRPFQAHLRVKYPEHINHPLCLENLWSHSYMKLYPNFAQMAATNVYPSGETTTWVDRVLNRGPKFNNFITQMMDEDGEGFLA